VADWKHALRRVLYPAYEARMVRRMPTDRLPRHIGVMLDGNRRWAKAVGADTAQGHRAGAANIEPLLGWCEEVGVQVVTLWLLSTDNLNRPAAELEPLLGIIGDAVDSLAAERRWRLHPVGALDLLPAATAARLKAAEEATRDVEGILVNIAVGYGGRREIADARAGRSGQDPRGARRDRRRRAHRRTPLHQGPARSRSGDPDVR
jgi:short-chain Z-isoprenyl diphosphate synthase